MISKALLTIECIQQDRHTKLKLTILYKPSNVSSFMIKGKFELLEWRKARNEFKEFTRYC